MRMSELLNEVRRFELDEGFSPREIKMAIGIASDPRYAKGNMTGAVNAIEKMKKGLSDHPQVAAVLKRQNEKVETDEAVSPAQQAAIAISKKEKGEKPKEEGNTFGKELKAARDKGEKTFVVSGKKYNVEDYDVDEAKVEPSRIVEPYRPEFGLDEISTFSRAHIAILKKTFDPMRDKKLGPKGQAKLSKIMDMIGDKKDALIDLFKADIPFVSQSAAAKLITKYNMKGDEINKLKEEVELDEKYDLYHKDFSSAMQHAYSYAKSKMGITVDPKEIDSKVATGPKKPTEGKTNKYMLKGKGGNLQIQVYNKGGSKPFELNMYKEENELDEAKSQGMFIVLEKGSKNKVIGQFKDKKKSLEMKNKNAGSKVIQIGKFATTDDKPVDIKVGDELSYTRVKLATKVKEENNLIAAAVGHLSND